MFVGHWTPYCEDWYQKRLREIAEGRATLYTATQWTKRLRFEKQRITKLFESITLHRERYLRRVPNRECGNSNLPPVSSSRR